MKISTMINSVPQAHPAPRTKEFIQARHGIWDWAAPGAPEEILIELRKPA